MFEIILGCGQVFQLYLLLCCAVLAEERCVVHHVIHHPQPRLEVFPLRLRQLEAEQVHNTAEVWHRDLTLLLLVKCCKCLWGNW